MNTVVTPELPALSNEESKIMGLLFNDYYLEMTNKIRKYVHDSVRAHDLFVHSLETVVRRKKTTEIKNVKNYLFVVLIHNARRVSRVSGPVLILKDDFNKEEHLGEDASSDYLFRELKGTLDSCIAKLPPKQSQLYKLIVEERKSLIEAAELTNNSYQQVKANWWVIKKKIIILINRS